MTRKSSRLAISPAISLATVPATTTKEAKMYFQDIRVLYLLPLSAAFTVLLWWANLRIRRRARAAFGDELLINRLSRPLNTSEERLRLVGWLIVSSLVTAAGARPVASTMPTSVQ